MTGINTELSHTLRTRFPLVVVLLTNEDDLECELKESDTVALVNVIHVKDSVCSHMDTNFVFKLSKMANGQVLNVTNLYTRTEQEGNALCSVCLTSKEHLKLNLSLRTVSY